MKYSPYNIVIKELADSVIIYNTASGGICELENTHYQKLQLRKDIDVNFPFFKELRELEIIIDSDSRHVSNTHKNSLTIVFSLTQKCNLSCYYCFEKKDHYLLDNNHDFSQNIIDILERVFILDTNVSELRIVWFGGEPLLESKKIVMLSKMIILLCTEYKIKYSASLVTNGTIYNHDLIDNLTDYHISHIQVSVDGCLDKFIENKHGNRIFWDSHLRFLNAISAVCDVTIRLNIDKHNITSIKEYLSFINKLHILEKVNINISRIDTDNSQYSLSYKEFYTLKIELLYYLIYELHYDEEDRIFKELTPIDTPCKLLCEKSIVIDSNSYCHKCEDEIGTSSNVTIYDAEKCVQLIYQNRFQYNLTCYNCPIFPLCKCDCPKHWDMNNCNLRHDYIKKLALMKYKLLEN